MGKESQKKVMIKRYRPEGWDDKVIPALIEECIKTGEIEFSDGNERNRVELFISYCINLGADTMLKTVRPNGVDAMVENSIVKTVRLVGGKLQYGDTGMRHRTGYSGPGRVVFIPADKELFRIS